MDFETAKAAVKAYKEAAKYETCAHMKTSNMRAYKAFSSSRTDAQPGQELYSNMARKFPILAKKSLLKDEVPQTFNGALLYEDLDADHLESAGSVHASINLADWWSFNGEMCSEEEMHKVIQAKTNAVDLYFDLGLEVVDEINITHKERVSKLAEYSIGNETQVDFLRSILAPDYSGQLVDPTALETKKAIEEEVKTLANMDDEMLLHFLKMKIEGKTRVVPIGKKIPTELFDLAYTASAKDFSVQTNYKKKKPPDDVERDLKYIVKKVMASTPKASRKRRLVEVLETSTINASPVKKTLAVSTGSATTVCKLVLGMDSNLTYNSGSLKLTPFGQPSECTTETIEFLVGEKMPFSFYRGNEILVGSWKGKPLKITKFPIDVIIDQSFKKISPEEFQEFMFDLIWWFRLGKAGFLFPLEKTKSKSLRGHLKQFYLDNQESWKNCILENFGPLICKSKVGFDENGTKSLKCLKQINFEAVEKFELLENQKFRIDDELNVTDDQGKLIMSSSIFTEMREVVPSINLYIPEFHGGLRTAITDLVKMVRKSRGNFQKAAFHCLHNLPVDKKDKEVTRAQSLLHYLGGFVTFSRDNYVRYLEKAAVSKLDTASYIKILLFSAHETHGHPSPKSKTNLCFYQGQRLCLTTDTPFCTVVKTDVLLLCGMHFNLINTAHTRIVEKLYVRTPVNKKAGKVVSISEVVDKLPQVATVYEGDKLISLAKRGGKRKNEENILLQRRAKVVDIGDEYPNDFVESDQESVDSSF